MDEDAVLLFWRLALRLGPGAVALAAIDDESFVVVDVFLVLSGVDFDVLAADEVALFLLPKQVVLIYFSDYFNCCSACLALIMSAKMG